MNIYQLQQRQKWMATSANEKHDQLVITIEDNVLVMQWPIGRIMKTYNGQDGIVADLDVKTLSGVIKRSIHRLAPLLDDGPEKEGEHIHLKRVNE